MGNSFFLILLATIIVTRITLFIKPVPSPTIRGFRTHHWMYGLGGVVIAFLTRSVVVYAIGMGLCIDELTYLLMAGETHEDNFSLTSLIGTIAFTAAAFLLREQLISALLR